jgi:hypothetical protein
MSDPAALTKVEALLADELRNVTDKKGDNLLRRESAGVALLPEASRHVAQTIAASLLRELAKVVEDLRAAHNTPQGATEPDWNRVANALAVTATRRVGQALGRSFRAYRNQRDAEGSS